MILQGNQRSGGRDLARHLLSSENEHIEVHDIRGFVADDLHGAFDEAQAMSKGTKAKQYLFSLSLNPPVDATVSTEDFKKAISAVEDDLNLKGQPRAIVFHEKQGRRHCHVVWSRIDTKAMKAIPLPHTKRKLMDRSRELYVQHGWTMPQGMVNHQERDPANFTLAQWQQAKRMNKDPRAIKRSFQEAWAISDNQAAFQHALKERGFLLARGDRRGVVAMNHHCEIFSVPKWVGVKTKMVNSKIKEKNKLPSVDEVKAAIAQGMMDKLKAFEEQQNQKIKLRLAWLQHQKTAMRKQHKDERAQLEQKHHERHLAEAKERQARFRSGLSGLWERITGKRRQIEDQNKIETYQSVKRDRSEKDQLIYRQLLERQKLHKKGQHVDRYKTQRMKTLSRDKQQYQEIKDRKRDIFDRIEQEKQQTQERDHSQQLER